jgi:hypothetical protein
VKGVAREKVWPCEGQGEILFRPKLADFAFVRCIFFATPLTSLEGRAEARNLLMSYILVGVCVKRERERATKKVFS